MVFKKLKIILSLTLVLFFLFKFSGISFSQTPQECIDKNLNNDQCIEYLKNKVIEIQKQEKTISSQIAAMNGQIRLTEFRIISTQEQITSLALDIDTATKKISFLQESLDNSITVLLKRIVATYQAGTIQPLQILLTSGRASDFLQRLNYLRLAQAHDKKLIYETQQAKVDYASEKSAFQDKKKKVEALKTQLEAYTKQLEEDKKSKQAFLEATKNDEARYQRLLQQAQAERAIVFGGGSDVYMRDVNQGDSIGSVASHSLSPGCSSGAHLHFEVQKNNSVQDPNNYLRSGSYSYSYPESQYSYYGTINPHGDLPWPLNEPISINQGYGSHGFAQTFYSGGVHTGIDMDSSSSTVKAIKAGKLYGGSYNCTNGKLYYAKVIHDDGLTTWYLHMIPN